MKYTQNSNYLFVSYIKYIHISFRWIHFWSSVMICLLASTVLSFAGILELAWSIRYYPYSLSIIIIIPLLWSKFFQGFYIAFIQQDRSSILTKSVKLTPRGFCSHSRREGEINLQRIGARVICICSVYSLRIVNIRHNVSNYVVRKWKFQQVAFGI